MQDWTTNRYTATAFSSPVFNSDYVSPQPMTHSDLPPQSCIGCQLPVGGVPLAAVVPDPTACEPAAGSR